MVVIFDHFLIVNNTWKRPKPTRKPHIDLSPLCRSSIGLKLMKSLGVHQKCIDSLLEIVPQPTLAKDYGVQLLQENHGCIYCEYWETISFHFISRTMTGLVFNYRINTKCNSLQLIWTKVLNMKQDYRLAKKKKTSIFLYLSVQFSGTYLWDWAGQTNGHTSVYITAL